MRVNYVTVSRQLAFDFFRTSMEENDDWRDELYQDYVGPIIVHDKTGNRRGLTGNYGLIPKRHLPSGQRLTTMNAHAETVGQLRTYKSARARSQLCLVPMVRLFEPNCEQPTHVRWSIGMATDEPFAVAGLYREWENEDGKKTFFVHPTDHQRRRPSPHESFPSPGEEKRSLVIVSSADYDDWLGCKDRGRARTHLQPYPAKLMAGEPAPKVAVALQKELF